VVNSKKKEWLTEKKEEEGGEEEGREDGEVVIIGPGFLRLSGLFLAPKTLYDLLGLWEARGGELCPM
jgi:hypothetical protein